MLVKRGASEVISLKNLLQHKDNKKALYKSFEIRTSLQTYNSLFRLVALSSYITEVLGYVKYDGDRITGTARTWLFSTLSNTKIVRNSGLPTSRNAYGNGALIVLTIRKKGEQQIFSTKSQAASWKYNTRRFSSYVDSSSANKEHTGYRGSYRNFFFRDPYITFYEKLKSKSGNMTEGADNQTFDSISLAWVDKTIQQFKDRSFKFKPVKKKYIPKKNGKLRPLGIPTPRDKIIQSIFKETIECFFERKFLHTSHGFRPYRSCHTALKEIRKWSGITWLIEGDIKGYFDNIDHQILAELLSKEIKDKNLIDLYWKLVKAGYVEEGKKKLRHSLTGVPQGTIISPFLSNVYLHEFDVFMEELCASYTTSGPIVKKASEYNRIQKKLQKARREKNQSEINRLEKLRMELPSTVRVGCRVYYVRYADDWVIGLCATKKVAEEIKNKVEVFLAKVLKIKLSTEKTLITNLTAGKGHFLGVNIRRHNRKYTKSLIKWVKGKRVRGHNNRVILDAPINALVNKLHERGMTWKDGYPKAKTQWIHLQPYDIIQRFNEILVGILNYYSFVDNRTMLYRIIFILKYSLVYTLCRKWRISPRKLFKKLGNSITWKLENGKTIKFKQEQDMKKTTMNFKISENTYDPLAPTYYQVRTTKSMLFKDCSICGSKDNIEMHHIKHLRGEKLKGFNKLMGKLKRKQLPVCKECHVKIHNGTYAGVSLKSLKDNL